MKKVMGGSMGYTIILGTFLVDEFCLGAPACKKFSSAGQGKSFIRR